MTRPRPPAWLLAATLCALGTLALLGGCSGDDDTAPPPITAQAAADAATVIWNAPTTIDVLANDSVSRGDKRLSAVARQPANGTATVADGRLTYTPRAGFFGSDSLRYTVASADGTATAEAEVAITVEAELLLNGTAVDAPLANATIRITGAAIAQAVADARGAWQARVRTSDPAGVLRIDAAGTGTQAHVRLASLAATPTLASAATADGTVAADKAEALAVTHFSTAQAALIARTPAGVPTTATALAAAQAAVDPAALLNLATLIHMAADEGLALPGGKADTWALAADATASAALLAAQATADGTAFSAAQARALGAAPAAGLLPTSGTLMTFPAAVNFTTGTVFVLAADGTAQVTANQGTRRARWTQDANGLVLTLDTPFSSTNFSGDIDPVTGDQNQLRSDLTAYRLKRLPGGLVTVSMAYTQTYLDGSRIGQVLNVSALSDPGDAHRLAVDPAGAAPLAAADFAVGRRWAGVLLSSASSASDADVLTVTAAGSARTVRTGTDFTLQVNGPAFTLAGADGSRREYLRLGDAGDGAAWFMVFDRSGAADAVSAQVAVLVPQAAALAFDATSASRTWLFDSGPGVTPSQISLRADGTGTYIDTAAVWQVLADGRLRIIRPRTATRQTTADWILLSRGADGSAWVLRRLVQENPATPLADDAAGSLWVVLRYRAGGPAT